MGRPLLPYRRRSRLIIPELAMRMTEVAPRRRNRKSESHSSTSSSPTPSPSTVATAQRRQSAQQEATAGAHGHSAGLQVRRQTMAPGARPAAAPTVATAGAGGGGGVVVVRNFNAVAQAQAKDPRRLALHGQGATAAPAAAVVNGIVRNRTSMGSSSDLEKSVPEVDLRLQAQIEREQRLDRAMAKLMRRTVGLVYDDFRRTTVGLTESAAKHDFIERCRALPTYGAIFFPIKVRAPLRAQGRECPSPPPGCAAHACGQRMRPLVMHG